MIKMLIIPKAEKKLNMTLSDTDHLPIEDSPEELLILEMETIKAESAQVIQQLNDKINALEDKVEELTNKIIRLETR